MNPKQTYFDYDFKGAKFIWTDDIDLDNTVVFRTVVKTAPDGKVRQDFTNLNNTVPDGPPKKPKSKHLQGNRARRFRRSKSLTGTHYVTVQKVLCPCRAC